MRTSSQYGFGFDTQLEVLNDFLYLIAGLRHPLAFGGGQPQERSEVQAVEPAHLLDDVQGPSSISTSAGRAPRYELTLSTFVFGFCALPDGQPGAARLTLLAGVTIVSGWPRSLATLPRYASAYLSVACL